ncbi:homocysteine S-methyltransferase [Azorhizobium oxalatiphilum]|uniref:Homocysteine S-methyltransferase n=1 Tax=Azorhizobium oxalatiphilum TaxID=980631 RepID=A0A917FI37_9HYPH|nr:homocysteine S-methyltransferase family protein [Azorhizobium oxalatiphilum]GGF86461.1 homocysteine S-methyltransferase [Azorhizobium oxalatiphilum]
MPRYRNHLPQLGNGLFLSDGGLETSLIFHDGVDLPHFAAFILLDSADGRERLTRYYQRYMAIARAAGTGFVLDSATWRANADWGEKLGYDAAALRAVNMASIRLLEDLRAGWDAEAGPCVISGAIGPRGDGYKAGAMDADAAQAYHAPQIEAFADAGADMVTAYTLTGIAEAIGVARAAQACSMPCAISFTVETDGRLITGHSLREAVERVDTATGSAPVYFMINCAHPTHFQPALEAGEPWTARIRGVRANASTLSHAELDESETLDAGDPAELGRHYRALRQSFPGLKVLGGCCGTDHRHVAAICEACVAPAGAA